MQQKIQVRRYYSVFNSSSKKDKCAKGGFQFPLREFAANRSGSIKPTPQPQEAEPNTLSPAQLARLAVVLSGYTEWKWSQIKTLLRCLHRLQWLVRFTSLEQRAFACGTSLQHQPCPRPSSRPDSRAESQKQGRCSPSNSLPCRPSWPVPNFCY